MKILVIQPKMIGDVLTTGVIFEALSKKFPEAQLHYLINENTLPVVLHNPYIDEFLLIGTNNQKGIVGFYKILSNIKNQKYNVIIDCYASLKTALFCKLSSVEKTISFYKSYTNFLYTKTVERAENSISKATKAIEHRMQLLEPLEIEYQILKPKIYLLDEEVAIAKQNLLNNKINLNQQLVMISAIGSNLLKTYPLPFMAQVIDLIAQEKNMQIIFNYLPNQKSQALELFNLCKLETKEKIHFDFYTKSLREFIAVTNCCTALIGNEGGATNMAKALNIPTFTIFSPIVLKHDWNIFENETTNISVHLNDYLPTSNNFNEFDPNFFKEKLIKFVQSNCHSK